MSAQEMEPARSPLNAGSPSAEKVVLQDEQANPECGFKLTSASTRVLSTHENHSQREVSQSSKQVLTDPMFNKNQLHDQDSTGKFADESTVHDVAMITSSKSFSESLDTSSQTNLVGQGYILKEETEEKDSAFLIQKSIPTLKDETPECQLRNEFSSDYVLGSAENLLQVSEITTSPTPPATALAPSSEPTVAICDGSLETSQIELSVDVATNVSGHLCNPEVPPNETDEHYSNGISIDTRSGHSEELNLRKELTLDELVQGFKNSEDDKAQSIISDESTRSSKPLHPNEFILATSGAQKIETDDVTAMELPIKEEANDMGPEFMLDSSPIVSSSSDTSSDQSSSDDDNGDDDDDDYQMLDPAEQAARLMQEDIGSDGEGTGRGNSGAGAGPPRTLNEKPDEIVPKPDLIVTEKMKIEELGHVENIVENLVLIKAKTSGDHQVLESGSVLCLEKRTVVGVVAETLGRVEQPYYTVHFTNERAIAEAGISKGTNIFYVEQHSTSVFTQPLKYFKGSDASNLHDEEVGDEGIEFSDDEAEAEHKRKLKLAKQAKRDIRDGSRDGSSQRGRQRGGKMQKRGGPNNPNQSKSSRIDYDEPEGGDDLYTPLARPPNLHEIMGRNEAPVEDHNLHRWADRSSRGGRGRSDRGRGRGDRGRGNRGHGSNRGNPGDSVRRASGRPNYTQSLGGDAGRQPGRTDLPPASTDAAFPYHAAARQPQVGPPTPSTNQPGPQNSAHQSHYGQSNNHYNQANTQTSFYPPAPQTSHSHPQPQPPQFNPPSQPSQYFPPPQTSQYFPPPLHHQPPIPYPQYHAHPPSSPTPNVPAGSFINPAFFPLATTQSAFPQWPQLNSTQQASTSASAGGTSQMSPESERAFQAINILRNLSARNESQPHPT